MAGSIDIGSRWELLLDDYLIAHMGRGRIVNPPTYTAGDWAVPAGAHA